MPAFSDTSKYKLKECHKDIQRLMNVVIKYMNITVVCGYRSEHAQNIAYAENNSTYMFPNSKHNITPSHAIDIAPYPIDWTDKEKFILMGGLVLGVAKMMNIDIIWGGDWKGKFKMNAHGELQDYGHFELNI